MNKQKLFDLLLQPMPRKHESKGVALLKSVSIYKSGVYGVLVTRAC